MRAHILDRSGWKLYRRRSRCTYDPRERGTSVKRLQDSTSTSVLPADTGPNTPTRAIIGLSAYPTDCQAGTPRAARIKGDYIHARIIKAAACSRPRDSHKPKASSRRNKQHQQQRQACSSKKRLERLRPGSAKAHASFRRNKSFDRLPPADLYTSHRCNTPHEYPTKSTAHINYNLYVHITRYWL